MAAAVQLTPTLFTLVGQIIAFRGLSRWACGPRIVMEALWGRPSAGVPFGPGLPGRPAAPSAICRGFSTLSSQRPRRALAVSEDFLLTGIRRARRSEAPVVNQKREAAITVRGASHDSGTLPGSGPAHGELRDAGRSGGELSGHARTDLG